MRARADRRRVRARRLLGVVALAALVGAGCSSSRTPFETSALDALSPNERNLVADAEAWLDGPGAVQLAPGDELVFLRLESAPDVSHVVFGQVVEDHPVLGSEIAVHVLADGEIQGATDSLTAARPVGPDDPEIDRAEAEETAEKAVMGSALIGRAEVVWFADSGDLRLAWRLTTQTEDPVGSWEILVDAESGDVVSVVDVLSAAECGAPAPPSACVFIPDPVYANGGVAVPRDQADQFLEGVALEGLDDPSSGRLVGDYVDVDPPGAPVAAPRETDGTWELGVDDVGFEHAMVYYWVDRTQRLIQDLGFTDLRNGPMEIYANVPGADFISHFDPSEQRIEFGINALGDGEDGEDAYLVLHEYGHAVLDAQIGGLRAGQHLGDTSAYHEGFGNLLAFFATLEERGNGPDASPTCLGYWSYGGCIGALDQDLRYPDDVTFEVHLDGDIFTTAAYDVFEVMLAADGLTLEDCLAPEGCNAVRDRMLTTILTANGYLPADFTFDDVARAYVSANEAVAGGADATDIVDAFAAHGFDAAPGSGGTPSVSFYIQHPREEDLEVTVDVIDPEGQSLCETVEIAQPDRPADFQDLAGRIDLDDSDCTAHLPPSPQARWVLRIANSGSSEGYLYGFAVSDGVTPYVLPEQGRIPAGGEVAWAIDGSGEPASTGGTGAGGGTGTGGGGEGPVASITITHPYTGDIAMFAGVLESDGTVICSVQALDPRPGERGDGGLTGDIDLSDCAGDYPPSSDRTWFVRVADLATQDEGTVDELTLTGPDGQVLAPDESLPAAIPDADPEGLVFTFSG